MDEQEYRMKASQKQLELFQRMKNKEIDKDIYHLEMMYWNIQPYSLYWRNGYKKSLLQAIKALGGNVKDLQ